MGPTEDVGVPGGRFLMVRIIIAKFNSACPACSFAINAGDRVEWEAGKKAKHVKCPAKASDTRSGRTPTRTITRARKPSPPKVEGEVRIERPSKGPNDGF